MNARLAYVGLAALLIGALPARSANTPSALDLPPSNVMPGAVDMSPNAPQRTVQSAPTGNPLWAIPLSALTATRDRPLFLPSRRPPAPAVAGTPVVAAPAPAPAQPAEPEQPPLTLVGAVAGEHESFAVFLDQATNSVIRLKTGQDHSGWVLRSVKGREAILQKDRRTTTLALPVPGVRMAPGEQTMPAGQMMPTVPSAPGQPPRSGVKEPEL